MAASRRTRRNLLMEDDFVGVQLPIIVRRAGGGLLQGRVGRAPGTTSAAAAVAVRLHMPAYTPRCPDQQHRSLSCQLPAYQYRSTFLLVPCRLPAPSPPYPSQHVQLLLRHPQLLLACRGGRAAAGTAHHRRWQLLQPPAQHLLQLLCAAARPAVDHKHIQREAVLGVEGVRLADVQPKVALRSV